MNPAYHQPLGYVLLGVSLVLVGLGCLVAFYVTGTLHLDAHSYSLAVPITCLLGGIIMAVGCCLCCSRRANIQRHWDTCRRKQQLHRVVIGRPDDPSSRQQPIISGYDPRMLSKLPDT